MYPQVFGKYVLERELARGGMARVMLATLRGAGGFEKRLVVKQIRDELAFDAQWVRRFVEEAKTTVALSHPNIVPVYELGVEQGTYFLAMELVEGVTVAELLKHGGPLSPEEGAYVGVEVCRALDYAHRRMEVVHRDVTPRNVMVDEEGQIKVIDFGIAAPSEVEGHEVFGSPGHMPPEQIEGGALGPATDIFAVAVTLVEAWSGKAPFRRKTLAECAEAMNAAHPRPSDTNARLAPLDDLFARAMSLDPAMRPQSADELGKALRKFLATVDTGDVARGLGERVQAARAKVAENARQAASASVRPRAASVGDAATKTFAARQEVGAWKPVPPKVALPTPATPVVTINPATRRIPASVPPPPVAPIATPKPEAQVPIETIATASIDRASHSRPPRTRGTAIALVAVLVTAAAALVLRESTTSNAIPTPTPPPTSTSTPTPTPTPTPTSTPTPTPTSTPSASASASASTSSDPSSPAHLTLLADPGTRASIDGTPRGHCPLRDLALEPGPHDIRFTFEPTGESSGERLTLRASEKVTLRADFSSATPAIRVER